MLPHPDRILDKRVDCNQLGLDNCKINNCSDERMVAPRQRTPVPPDWNHSVGVWMDDDGPVPAVNVTWKIKSDGSVKTLRGTAINIQDESTNQSICVQFSYKLNSNQQQNPNYGLWTFSLDGVMVELGHTYRVSVFNLPEPETLRYRTPNSITIPGCSDTKIQRARVCLENGSLWDPPLTTTVTLDEGLKKFFLVVGFEAAEYAERYLVSILSHGFHCSKNISKENRTRLNVTFEFDVWQLSQCEVVSVIQPFFIGCKNDCRRHEEKINFCQYYLPRTLIIKATVGLLVICGFLAYSLWRVSQKDTVNASSSAAKQQSDPPQVHERRRVLIIYSLDHPLYKHIVLKLCAFLSTKCGTDVVLDLLDSTRLGVLGGIQWLDWHREQIESSSDKILILCSQGVQAKWRAMCGGKQLLLREDSRSTAGDMLSPALSLMIPHLIRSASFEKYIVAYFDDVCSEEDVPSPFNITVRYKLMKQFEELFFRILDTEKHEPGRMNHIKGLSEDEYCHCPSGRALRDAIEAFRAYQLEHPQWFEDELLETSELKVQETSPEICDDATATMKVIAQCVANSTQTTQESNPVVFNHHIAESNQPA
ncbi:interleukin-17 receptor A isoform X2 [Plectropomus leopardus]|uniref:interleukin-17 receptor A isoform X2 n=1 Tax=Plectropomus leopardus TaxID=160734 RepID=UPI001C4D3A96|nr:interleukin-17 receptor A isoform X2 [Plectropomus leopardus]